MHLNAFYFVIYRNLASCNFIILYHSDIISICIDQRRHPTKVNKLHLFGVYDHSTFANSIIMPVGLWFYVWCPELSQFGVRAYIWYSKLYPQIAN